ncbi:MAG TPA: class I SAM-dependent methyltransferase [Chthoniobacterales bacterium]
MPPIGTEIDDPEPFSIEDEKFDRIFPPRIRKLSSLFWTPVAVAARGAELLVTTPGVRVLDIGCGPGKFCLIGASITDGCFTGVEQRAELLAAAVEAATRLQLTNVNFVQQNITDVAFTDYDAFYLFNPFEENMHGHKIDSDVPLSPALFKRYARHVADQLGAMPLGTRVVSYAGYGDEVPACYDCELALFRDDLKLWIKNRDYDPDAEQLGLAARRSYRGSLGWAPPR